MVPAGISLFGHFRQKDRIPFLSSFHQLVHVTGYLPVGNLCIDLRTVDVRMAHHLGDALYRDAGGQHQGSERMAGHVVGQVLLHAQCHAHSMYLVPEDIADRQREYRPVVIRGVVKLQYLSGYGMQRDERLHVRFGAADADIPSSFRSRSDVTGMESPRIRVSQTGQRGEDERPARQLHHRVGQRGFHHPLQFTAADMP